jgi:uncharacterized membrane protein
MRSKLPWILFGAALLGVVFFVLHTAPSLPPMVASHFDAAGVPDSFMPREGYIRFMLALGIGLPLASVAVLALVFSNAHTMNLPNRQYWLAPERIASTRAFLLHRAAWFGAMMTVLMGLLHYLELNANAQVPPHLSSTLFMGTLLAFAAVTLGWVAALRRTFRRPRGHPLRPPG